MPSEAKIKCPVCGMDVIGEWVYLEHWPKHLATGEPKMSCDCGATWWESKRNPSRLSFEHFRAGMEACGYGLKVDKDGFLDVRGVESGLLAKFMTPTELAALGWDMGWLDE